jgi:hypothetical protein
VYFWKGVIKGTHSVPGIFHEFIKVLLTLYKCFWRAVIIRRWNSSSGWTRSSLAGAVAPPQYLISARMLKWQNWNYKLRAFIVYGRKKCSIFGEHCSLVEGISSLSCRSKFIIAFLSNTALFIKQSREDFVREEVTKWQRSNTYEYKTSEQ